LKNNLIVIEKKSDASEIIEDAMKKKDEMQCVIILSILKNGNFFYSHNSMGFSECAQLKIFHLHTVPDNPGTEEE